MQNISNKHHTTLSNGEKELSSGMDSTFAFQRLPPENAEGNTEYKWRLINVGDSRLQELVTQLKFRLKEGNGFALYYIGVKDDGECSGLNVTHMDESLETLDKMACQLQAQMSIMHQWSGIQGIISKVKITEAVAANYFPEEFRIVVMGVAHSGKSSLIGTLTSGILDNGCGLSRMSVFKHRHELLDGRTSSVCHQLIGYDENGHCITIPAEASHHHDLFNSSETCQDNLQRCKHLVKLIDLAGDERYMRSTFRGLCGSLADSAIVVYRYNLSDNDNNNSFHKVENYLRIAMMLVCNSLIVVVTFCEILNFETRTMIQHQIKNLIKKIGSEQETTGVPCVKCNYWIKNYFDDIVYYSSAVSGEGITELRQVLFRLSTLQKRPSLPFCRNPVIRSNKPVVFVLDEAFLCSEGLRDIPLVFTGTLYQGVLNNHATLYCGPFISRHRDNYKCRKFKTIVGHPDTTASEQDGIYTSLCPKDTQYYDDESSDRYYEDLLPPWIKLHVKSIQRHRIPVKNVAAGQTCSLGLMLVDETDNHSFSTHLLYKHIRPGLALVENLEVASKHSTTQITIQLTLLPNSSDLKNLVVEAQLAPELSYSEGTFSSSTTSKHRIHNTPYMIYVHSTRQPVHQITTLSGHLKPGQTGNVRLTFANRVEFILKGMICALWGGGLYGCGHVLD